MSNFKFLLSEPGFVAFADVAIAAESPLRPVCALGPSPKGRGEGLRGRGEGLRGRGEGLRVCWTQAWLSLWESCQRS